MVALESLVGNGKIRDINPTTKRLVERCLGGDWCVQLKKTTPIPITPVADLMRVDSPGPTGISDNHLLDPGHTKQKSMKPARSVENLRAPPMDDRRGNVMRKASTDSSNSLPIVAVASSRPNRDRSDSNDTMPKQARPPVPHPVRADSMGIYETTSPRTLRPGPEQDTLSVPPRVIPSPSGRRSAPPVPPVKRRKPPAVPAHRSPKLNAVNGGGKNMATVGPTLTSSPLSRDF